MSQKLASLNNWLWFVFSLFFFFFLLSGGAMEGRRRRGEGREWGKGEGDAGGSGKKGKNRNGTHEKITIRAHRLQKLRKIHTHTHSDMFILFTWARKFQNIICPNSYPIVHPSTPNVTKQKHQSSQLEAETFSLVF